MGSYAIQVIDTPSWNSQQIPHLPVAYESEALARARAIDVTRRRQCICKVIRDGEFIATYKDGEVLPE